MADQTTAPCRRPGCGYRLLCCRPDCPLVAVDIELGVKRLYTRDEFVAAVRGAATGLGIDVDAIDRKARVEIVTNVHP
jgi:hypothetical protein